MLPKFISYKLVSLPANGTLKLASTVLSVGETFTQEELDKGLVTYSNPGSRENDTFSVEVSDETGSSISETAIEIFIDSDEDGLSDSQETVLGTDFNNSDTDGDGLSDSWETENELNPLESEIESFVAEVNGENGLTAVYNFGAFRQTTDFTSKAPAKVTKVSSINFSVYNWNGFANSGVKDYVGARFKGYLYVPIAGDYTFALTTDDGSRLYIDGDLIINNDGNHSSKRVEGSVTLSQGFHRIQTNYYEVRGAHVCILQWEGPGRSVEINSNKLLFLISR